MASLTPVIDDDERREEFDSNYERDRYHDSQISNIFHQIINPDSKIEDFIDESGRDRTQMTQNWSATRYMNGTIDVSTASGERRIIEVRPIESDEASKAPEAIAPAPVEAPVREQRLAQPDLVQDARVTSDLFRVKSTYEAQAPCEAPATQFAAPQVEEEENEDLLPTMTTRQFGAGGDARGDAVRTVEEEDDGRLNIVTEQQSFAATKREKTLIAVVVGVVVALVVLIIVNAAILMGMNRSAAAVEAEYDQAVEALGATQGQYEDFMSGLDDMAEELGMYLPE